MLVLAIRRHRRHQGMSLARHGFVESPMSLALSMVVIASMIGVKGLGQPVLKAITNQYFTMGLLNGLAIVVIAIVFDRVSQAYAKRSQKHLEGLHGA